MIRRALSLIIFRTILVCVALLYQLLAWLVGFRVVTPTPFLSLVVFVSLVSWLYYWGVLRRVDNPEHARRWVVVSLIVDAAVISVLVWMTGGIHSNFALSYLVIIPLGAIFVSKISIYALTVLCFVFLYMSVAIVAPLGYSQNYTQFAPIANQEMTYYLAGQFVIFFVTALVSALLQEAYRGTLQALRVKEQNIRWLKEMRNRIIDNMHSGLITTDDSGVIRFANQMAGRLFHQDNSLLLGKNVTALMNISFTDDTQSENWPQRTELWVDIGRDKRLMGISYSPIEFQPGRTGFLAVFQDLTEIKVLEQERRFKDKMAVIGKVAAGVAHEIRNPLASIKGSIQVLKEFVPAERDAGILLDIVEKESNRLNDIITTFLAYASPNVPVERRPVDLVTAFKDFAILAEKDESIRLIELRLNTSLTSAMVFGDINKIQQMFWNLVRNASQASVPGSCVEVSVEQDDVSSILKIKDLGCGMTEEQVADLFTPFLSHREGGSGLGMSIVYEIVQFHRAKIDVESQYNQGTTVKVTFPNYNEQEHGTKGKYSGR